MLRHQLCSSNQDKLRYVIASLARIKLLTEPRAWRDYILQPRDERNKGCHLHRMAMAHSRLGVIQIQLVKEELCDLAPDLVPDLILLGQ